MDIDIKKEPLTLTKIENLKQSYVKKSNFIIVGIVLMIGSSVYCEFFINSMFPGDKLADTQVRFIWCLLSAILHVFAMFFLLFKFSEYRCRSFGLTEIDPKSCLDIKKFLTLPEIKAYRDKVIDQPRKFIRTEVDAMREHYEDHHKKLQEYSANAPIRQACREVYGVTEGEA